MKAYAFLALLQLTLASTAITALAGLPLADTIQQQIQQPQPSYKPLPDLREQDRLEQSWLKERYDFIPHILKKYGFDAYLLTQREYAEDTVFKGLVSSTTIFSARRRTVYLFHTGGKRSGVPNPLVIIDNTPELWKILDEALRAIDPLKIGINVDSDLAFSDGLHTGEGQALRSNLAPKWVERLSSHRMLGVETIAVRAGKQEQLDMYRQMMENVWAMIKEGFSEAVVEPGKTTSIDLEWWFRARMQTLNVTTWFHPTVTSFDRGQAIPRDAPFSVGQMLHVDIGITAMNMNTDTQHLAYILRPNETRVPDGLRSGLRNANRMQQLVKDTMKLNKTGDEVLLQVKEKMQREGLLGLVYCHPIGDYGHSAGPLIGMTNLQDGVPGGGSLPFLENTWFSVELSSTTNIPEWGNVPQTFPLEEDVAWNSESGGWDWVYGHQTEFWLIRAKTGKSSGWRQLLSFFTRILARI